MPKVRPLWRHYLDETQGLIYVVDSSDLCHMEESRNAFYDVLKDLEKIPILILANKQDLSEALTVDEVREKMHLDDQIQGRSWHIQGTSAMSGEGLYEGIETFEKMLIEYQENKQSRK